MGYVVLIGVGVLLFQFFLSKSPVLGLMIPMASMLGVIIAGMMIFASDGGGWEAPNNRLTLLIFLVLTISSFLLYFYQRRNEYLQGYMSDKKTEKKTNNRNTRSE